MRVHVVGGEGIARHFAGRTMDLPAAWAEAWLADGRARTTEKEWPLKTPPAEYLEKKPDGPNADLAREILGMGGTDA